jgi:outer membrane protein assembly factor BamB
MNMNTWGTCAWTPRHIGAPMWHIGGNISTLSTPFAADGVVYFRGTGGGLNRVDIDGTNHFNIGNNTTSSTPFTVNGAVYFQGTNNSLYQINIDGTNRVQFDNVQIGSSPFVRDNVIYFQGYHDNALMMINLA